MDKRRAKHPLEDSPFIEGFLEWMDAPEGQQSIEALDQVFDALEHAGVDARHRKIVWADGKRLSIEQSVERIHAKGLLGNNCFKEVVDLAIWCSSIRREIHDVRY
jgi:hypothetical protein